MYVSDIYSTRFHNGMNMYNENQNTSESILICKWLDFVLKLSQFHHFLIINKYLIEDKSIPVGPSLLHVNKNKTRWHINAVLRPQL